MPLGWILALVAGALVWVGIIVGVPAVVNGVQDLNQMVNVVEKGVYGLDTLW